MSTDEEADDGAAQKVRDAKGRGRQDFNWSDDPWGIEQFQNPEVEKNDYEHALEQQTTVQKILEENPKDNHLLVMKANDMKK